MSEPTEGRLDPNAVWAALAYALGPVSGLVVLLYRGDERFVRFHALQSVIGGGLLLLAGGVLRLLSGLPVFGFLYGYLLQLFLLIVFTAWVWFVAAALRGRRARLPWVGAAVERYLY
ncbi:MAG: hypothetical protein IT349_22095 [Candidatus Eisenbacteria bacterium]|nr:hypothetical protein [Candidatus Eisenbacteria bacterium]MCC7144803.1 hypothetical protein [Candidatus Eisenbacteria bacterium]